MNNSKIKLKEIANVVAGQSPESKYYNKTGNGHPFLQGNRTFGLIYPHFDTWTLKLTKKATAGSVLLSVRAPVGDLNIAPQDLCIGRGLASITANDGDNRFLFYALKYNISGLLKAGTGTTFASVNRFDIENFDLVIPHKNQQDKIGKLLSALDDKIELNHRESAELEQMARTLYDYWFIQFDFPDTHGKPYKTSGGPMKHSPELNRQIPTNWEVLKLEDRLVFDKGTEPGASAYSDTKDDENDTAFYRVGDIDGNSSTYINASLFKPRLVSPSDVIVTFDGSVGKIGIGLDGAISGGLRHIYDKEGKISNATIYSIFRNEYIQKTIERYATGSVILHASSSIKYLAIPFDEKVVTEFQKIAQPLFDKIIANRQQSQNLAHLRDWLLPMLMNGQVTVKGGGK